MSDIQQKLLQLIDEEARKRTLAGVVQTFQRELKQHQAETGIVNPQTELFVQELNDLLIKYVGADRPMPNAQFTLAFAEVHAGLAAVVDVLLEQPAKPPTQDAN